MESVNVHDLGSRRNHTLEFSWRVSSSLLCLALAILVLTLLATTTKSVDPSSLLLGVALASFCVVLFFLYRSLLQLRTRQQQAAKELDDAEASLRESERRFRQMAENIQEIFWMVDAESKTTLYVNPAYETITGRSLAALKNNPLRYEELLHSEDRETVLCRLKQATSNGHFEEKFRIVWPNGEVRWVWLRGFPVRDIHGRIRRIVGTALDITTQKRAEEEVARHLSLAESAWAEADAMRKTSLALTQDLRMDSVLDTLLQSLRELVPYESAIIFLVETDSKLFPARESSHPRSVAVSSQHLHGFDPSDYPLIKRVLRNQDSLLVPDTNQDLQWRAFAGSAPLRSWLCVPLIASHRVVGLLSLGHGEAAGLTPDHLRIAELLAIPAAAAIQNARLYERSEIYSEELERRLADLHKAQIALATLGKIEEFPKKRAN